VSKSIQLSELDGYNEELESARKTKFREFTRSCDPEVKRIAFGGFASITLRRSPEFIDAFDQALGLQ